MKAAFAYFLVVFALTKAEVDWNNVFPKHIQDYPHGRIPHGLPNPRITGGVESEPNSHPYQVALFIPVSGGTAFCGGTLISQQTVLTAAHCVDTMIAPVTLVFGAHRIRDPEPTQVTSNSSGILIHPQWSSALIRNDVALIRLPTPIVFTPAIQPIELASNASNSFQGHMAHAVGWGLESDQATSISDVLREVDIPIIANSVCNIAFLGVIQDTHICASGLQGRSTCSGDSGGPLIVANQQVGITSFGIALGCEVGWPAAFTRVTSFFNWIKENTI